LLLVEEEREEDSGYQRAIGGHSLILATSVTLDPRQMGVEKEWVANLINCGEVRGDTLQTSVQVDLVTATSGGRETRNKR